MTRYPLLYTLIFSLCLLLITACEKSGISIPDEEINSITLANSTQVYTIHVNNEKVATSNKVIETGYQITINGLSYSFCLQIEEGLTMDGQTSTNNTYIKEFADGYTYLSLDDGLTESSYIPFPLKYGETLYGPFEVFTTSNITVTIIDFHSSYENKNGATFTDVFEAENDSGTIRIFINEAHFLIQKEDYRYAPSIQSLYLE